MLEKYFVRPLITGLLRLFYRVEIHGIEHYHAAGDRVLIICNHVSFLDPVLLGAFLPKKPAFAINVFQLKKWYFAWLKNFFTLYPLDPSQPLSMKRLIKDLREEGRVVLFPEGRITTSGGIMKVYEGTNLLVEKTQCAILPIRIDGAEMTPFARVNPGIRKWFPHIRITILPPKQYEEGDVTDVLDIYDIMTHAAYASTPVHNTLLNAIFEAAKLFGRGHVVIHDGVTRDNYTYGQILTRSFVLSNALKPLMSANKHVGLLMPTAAGGAITFIALHLLNRIPCLLNFSAGSSNVLHACNIAQLDTILTSRAFVEKGKLEDLLSALEEKYKVVYLEDLKKDIHLKDKLCGLFKSFFPRHYARHAEILQRHNPAAILYTSGSEGIPKGVALSHYNILSNIVQFRCVLDIDARDTLFNAMPMFHSFGLTVGTLTPLVCGVKTVLYPSPLHYRIVPELIYDTDSTIMLGTDTFYKGYARYAHPYDFWKIRLAVAGAEKLKASTKELYQQKFHLNITEGYGVTEASPVVSVNTELHHRSGSVGRLLPGIDYRVEAIEGLDEGGRLCIKGGNIMLGYLLSDEPGVIQPHEDWYDTGDIVTLDEDGYIFIQGRAKRFAKIAGEMVSLGVVEELAHSASENDEAAHAAVPVADERKGERIILYTEDEALQREALKKHAKSEGVMELAVPREVRHIAEVPRLGNGKIDYQSLLKMAKDDSKEKSEEENQE